MAPSAFDRGPPPLGYSWCSPATLNLWQCEIQLAIDPTVYVFCLNAAIKHFNPVCQVHLRVVGGGKFLHYSPFNS